MNPYADPFTEHTDAVTALMDAGVKPPTEWTKLMVRWQAFTTDRNGTALDALTTAILTGDTKADTDQLHALALLDMIADQPARAAVRNHIKTAVLEQLHAAYAPHAADNHGKAADAFDAAAQRLAAAAVVVDVEANAETIVQADDTIRSAWSDALLAAQDLDRAADVLATTAALAGLDTTGDEATLALTIDPGDTKRRTVWEAWDTAPGRCGRWAHMLAAGCTIRAHRDLDQFDPYRRPLPMREAWEPTGRGTARRIMVDPEETPAEDTTPRKRGHRIQML